VKRVFQSRYAPAIASAVLVALIAIAGVAVAGTATSSKKKKGLTAAQAKAIADQEIAAQAPGLSVARASNATNAANADNATNATNAGSANPIAFAHINADGSIDQAKSKDMANATVSRPSMGLYCFYQLGFAFKGAQVTTDYDDSSNEIGPQFGSTASGTCTPAANAYVSLPTSNGSAQANAGFFIVFYN
jgi:hypothetical protein